MTPDPKGASAQDFDTFVTALTDAAKDGQIRFVEPLHRPIIPGVNNALNLAGTVVWGETPLQVKIVGGILPPTERKQADITLFYKLSMQGLNPDANQTIGLMFDHQRNGTVYYYNPFTGVDHRNRDPERFSDESVARVQEAVRALIRLPGSSPDAIPYKDKPKFPAPTRVKKLDQADPLDEAALWDALVLLPEAPGGASTLDALNQALGRMLGRLKNPFTPNKKT